VGVSATARERRKLALQAKIEMPPINARQDAQAMGVAIRAATSSRSRCRPEVRKLP
jgi:hypothetical protein